MISGLWIEFCRLIWFWVIRLCRMFLVSVMLMNCFRLLCVSRKCEWFCVRICLCRLVLLVFRFS